MEVRVAKRLIVELNEEEAGHIFDVLGDVTLEKLTKEYGRAWEKTVCDLCEILKHDLGRQ